MFKKRFFEDYKKIGLNTHEAASELNMIMEYLRIDSLKEIKYGDFSKEEQEKNQ